MLENPVHFNFASYIPDLARNTILSSPLGFPGMEELKSMRQMAIPKLCSCADVLCSTFQAFLLVTLCLPLQI